MAFTDYVKAPALAHVKVAVGPGVVEYGQAVHPGGVAHGGFWYPTGVISVDVPAEILASEEKAVQMVEEVQENFPEDEGVVVDEGKSDVVKSSSSAKTKPCKGDTKPIGSKPVTTDTACAQVNGATLKNVDKLVISLAARKSVMKSVRSAGYQEESVFVANVKRALEQAGLEGTDEEVNQFCSASAGALKTKGGLIGFSN
jgi:hypothetical protein